MYCVGLMTADHVEGDDGVVMCVYAVAIVETVVVRLSCEAVCFGG